jgi:hypothetical protein
MRAFVAGLVLSMAVLFPNVGNAQVDPFRTPPPEVTAASSSWQIYSEPIFFQGVVYYPTREYRTFDGQVMAQIGVYEGVPIYADTTLEPWSIIYFSVGRERMRAYERARDRELAGTSGSRASWYPSTPASGGSTVVSSLFPAAPITPTLGDRSVGTSGSIAEERPVGTGGVSVPPPAVPSDIPERTRPARTRIETVGHPVGGSGGVWLNFNGDRWYSAGVAVPFVPERFTPVGEYRGFPVYMENGGDPNRIWVSVVQNGPLAPYEKR